MCPCCAHHRGNTALDEATRQESKPVIAYLTPLHALAKAVREQQGTLRHAGVRQIFLLALNAMKSGMMKDCGNLLTGLLQLNCACQEAHQEWLPYSHTPTHNHMQGYIKSRATGPTGPTFASLFPKGTPPGGGREALFWELVRMRCASVRGWSHPIPFRACSVATHQDHRASRYALAAGTLS